MNIAIGLFSLVFVHCSRLTGKNTRKTARKNFILLLYTRIKPIRF